MGGIAGVLHGSSLVTRDLDLCVLLTPENVQKLRACLKDLHPKHRMTQNKLSFLEYPEDVSTVKNLYLETDVGEIDFMTEITGVGDFKKISEKAHSVPLFGYECKVISLEDLINAKVSLGREKDLAMVRELKVVQKKKKDEKKK